ncbi:MAG: Trk system potassium transporter TrkA [Clostridiales bacterium]|jgi:trk system potassium uptake protein TrkA|nr:Trk system potassium transporter TrkA [Clostridiales bacterium]
MNVIIVGCGKVGHTIAKYLSVENHSITIIDKKAEVFDKVTESLDVMTLRGNALSARVLLEAGAKESDLIVCVAGNDETNILCALTAKRLGVRLTAARIRDPEYAVELMKFKSDLGLDLIINPEQQAAFEISRLIRFPTAKDIMTFVGGRVEIVAFDLAEGSPLDGRLISQIFAKIKIPVLLVTVERGGRVAVPHGDMELRRGDILRIAGAADDIMDFFRHIGIFNEKIRDIMVIGGGKITRYFCNFMARFSARLRIIEIDEERCQQLSEALPSALIIHGDGTDESVLESEHMGEMGAVVCLTDRDEENVIIAMYGKQQGVGKVVVKINHINADIVKKLNLGSVICPKLITSYNIIQFVRGMTVSKRSGSFRAMHKIVDKETAFWRGNNRAKTPGVDDLDIEALEFEVSESSKCLNIRLKDLPMKKEVLICCVVRNGNVIIPGGETEIHRGDNVIVITGGAQIEEFDDILK